MWEYGKVEIHIHLLLTINKNIVSHVVYSDTIDKIQKCRVYYEAYDQT
jgi:hypothetical protein